MILVALHGFAQDAANWTQRNGLSAECMARGVVLHALTPPRWMRDWRARKDAPDVAEFVTHLRVETGQSVFLAGFSDGARTALLAAGWCAKLSGLIFHSGLYRDEDLATSIPSCPVLCAWGERDVWTPTDRVTESLWNDLVARGVKASRAVHPGGHEWTPDCSRLVLDWCEAVVVSRESEDEAMRDIEAGRVRTTRQLLADLHDSGEGVA